MSTPDDTYNALTRTPLEEVMEMIFELDPSGSYTFNRMNSEDKWKVQSCYNYVVIEEGWTVDDFNNALDNYYKNR